jgi:hypothetical protein
LGHERAIITNQDTGVSTGSDPAEQNSSAAVYLDHATRSALHRHIFIPLTATTAQRCSFL